MPTITDRPPAKVRADLERLSAALGAAIPAKGADNLLLATWNIRVFASLTRKWTAASGDSPKRDLRGLRAIIEILSRFDVIAIQEVKGDLRALRDTLRFLNQDGDDWAFLMTDTGGNQERLAFLFDRRRVRPSGLAAELVVPQERMDRIGANVLREQFARTPYAVSFVRGQTTFILVTLHVVFGNAAADRIAEIQEIADWMRDWARRSNRFHHNLLTLGDFNIDRSGGPLYEAFTSTGLTVPPELMGLDRTIFDLDDDTHKFYDQIAWFATGRGALLDMAVRAGGNFNFMPHVYTGEGLSDRSVSFRVSDHLPLWLEFELP